MVCSRHHIHCSGGGGNEWPPSGAGYVRPAWARSYITSLSAAPVCPLRSSILQITTYASYNIDTFIYLHILRVLVGDWNVPSPFPSSTSSVPVPCSSTSGLPSPSKSATARKETPLGTDTGVPAVKVPSPWPRFIVPSEESRSSLPSPLKSATYRFDPETAYDGGSRNET